MIFNYSFSSFPQRAVILTATDGNRELSVTEPADGVPVREWKAFEKSGYSDAHGFLNGHIVLLEKLRRTERIMAETLQRIHRTSVAVEGGKRFGEYAAELIERVRAEQGNVSKASKYGDVINAWNRFIASRGGGDVLLVDFVPEIIDEFCEYAGTRGLKESTISFYCRILSAIYNNAVKDGQVNDARPFVNAPMSTLRSMSEPERISDGDLERLFTADLSDMPRLRQARDILRIACLTGLNFIEIVGIRAADLTADGIAVGGKVVPLDDEVCALLDTYAGRDYFFYPSRRGKPRTIGNMRARFFRAKTDLAVRLNLSASLSLNQFRLIKH